METDPGPPVKAPSSNPQESMYPGAGHMEVDATTARTSGDPPSQPGTTRSQPQAPASAH